MLLNYYTNYLEKLMQGRLSTMIGKTGKQYTFSSVGSLSEAALLPFVLHQHANIIVGSDNTPETGDSYCLKKEITSGINLGLARSVVDNDDGSHSSIVIVNCTNTSTAPVTIGEIGIEKYFMPTNNYDYFVFDRTPLGTPLTIQPGEVGRIVYTITMS